MWRHDPVEHALAFAKPSGNLRIPPFKYRGSTEMAQGIHVRQNKINTIRKPRLDHHILLFDTITTSCILPLKSCSYFKSMNCIRPQERELALVYSSSYAQLDHSSVK